MMVATTSQKKGRPMIAIMGATGRTGGGAAGRLLKAGEKVRVLGRSAERLKDFAAHGAEVAAGDAEDAAYLARAFTGADAAYVLMPPNATAPDYRAQQTRMGEAIAKAVKASGVTQVVMLSSIGADRRAGTGPILGLRELEDRLRAIPGVNLLALRPGYFYENTLGTLGLVKREGINGAAIDGNLPIAMVASRDIAEAAAEALHARDTKGFAVRELQGRRHLTLKEVTFVIGQAVGKPDLPYVQFGYDDLSRALVGMGFSQSMADLYGEMSRAFNEGVIRPTQPLGPRTATATRFEDWVMDAYVATYKAA
jgi:uncharacterized protein YbjT (DUF2867 family)